MRLAVIPLLALVLACAACKYPQDSEGTLARVQQKHVLRVGFSDRPPWILSRKGDVVGIEARLVKKLAAALGANVAWTGGSESALFRALREHQIDLMVAGLSKDAPLVRDAAPSKVCVRARVIAASPAAKPVPRSRADLIGNSIAYPRRRPDFAGMIAAAGGKPRPVEHVREHLSAVYDFEARRLGLVPSQVELAREDIVMLAARGESAMLFEIDRFLSRSCKTVLSELSANEAG